MIGHLSIASSRLPNSKPAVATILSKRSASMFERWIWYAMMTSKEVVYLPFRLQQAEKRHLIWHRNAFVYELNKNLTGSLCIENILNHFALHRKHCTFGFRFLAWHGYWDGCYERSVHWFFLFVFNHFHIWWVSPQRRCDHIYQISKWY